MTFLLTLPLIVPLLSAALSFLLWQRVVWQRALAFVSTFVLLSTAAILFGAIGNRGPQTTHLGNWPAPYGITLTADLLSSIMLVVTGLIGLVITLFSFVQIDRRRESFGYWPLVQVLLFGVNGAFLTGDLFNLYVWFEVLLMASFVLLALGGEPNQLRGSIIYVTLNLIASAILLAAVGIAYGISGTLNMAELAVKLRGMPEPTLITALEVLFLVAFGIKAAIFPLFFWLPNSYPTPPVAISALFAGLLTKVGVYALLRTFTLLFVSNPELMYKTILILSGFTMVIGVLGAASQFDVRRILSFHIISQIGYSIMGLGLSGMTTVPGLAQASLAGAIYFLVHNMLAKTNLFLISGISHRMLGSFALDRQGGLYQSAPALAVHFLIPAFSLAGLPPLSGFFGKLALIRAAIDQQQYGIATLSLIVGALTLYSMMKIWSEAFWKPRPLGQEGDGEKEVRLSSKERWCLYAPVTILNICIILLSLAAGPGLDVAARAAEQLLDWPRYVAIVLEHRP